MVISLEGLNPIPNDVDLDGQVLRDNLPPNKIAEQTLQFFHALRVQLVLGELKIVKTILIGHCFRIGAEKFITLKVKTILILLSLNCLLIFHY